MTSLKPEIPIFLISCKTAKEEVTWDVRQLYMHACRRGSSVLRSWPDIKRMSRGTRMCVSSGWRLCSVSCCWELPAPAVQTTPESNPGLRAGQATILSKTPIPCPAPHQQLPSQPDQTHDHWEHHNPKAAPCKVSEPLSAPCSALPQLKLGPAPHPSCIEGHRWGKGTEGNG